jgi:hypothetical protein
MRGISWLAAKTGQFLKNDCALLLLLLLLLHLLLLLL